MESNQESKNNNCRNHSCRFLRGWRQRVPERVFVCYPLLPPSLFSPSGLILFSSFRSTRLFLYSHCQKLWMAPTEPLLVFRYFSVEERTDPTLKGGAWNTAVLWLVKGESLLLPDKDSMHRLAVFICNKCPNNGNKNFKHPSLFFLALKMSACSPVDSQRGEDVYLRRWVRAKHCLGRRSSRV